MVRSKVKLAGPASRVLDQPVPVDGHLLHVAVTAGIIEGPRSDTRPTDWLRQADIAVRWAHTDRQTHRVFDPRRADNDAQRHRLALTDLPKEMHQTTLEPGNQEQP